MLAYIINMSQSVSPESHGGEGNTKPPLKARGWCFTWNNYLDDDFEAIKSWLSQKSHWVLGKERGSEAGTPHLQGYFYGKQQIRFDTLKRLWPKCHWEVARADHKAQLTYCSKDGDYVTNMEKPNIKETLLNKQYGNVSWHPWQQEVLDLIDLEPDDRTINWYWEPTGRVGKSFLAKYIALTNEIIIADGKRDNVFNQINQAVNVEGKTVRIIILDVPRHQLEYINYGMLEQIKNGMIYSGKYEGGQIFMDYVHVIVFANRPPDVSKMSEDRWNIRQITPSSTPADGTIPPGYWAPGGPKGYRLAPRCSGSEFEV